jgi:hypothetical protein
MSTLKNLPLPPFVMETALQKVVALDAAWNSKDPLALSRICSQDIEWQEGLVHLHGFSAVLDFLLRSRTDLESFKSQRTVWGFRENRMAVRFLFEWQQDGSWCRMFGNELLAFDANGLLQKRFASSSRLGITNEERTL